MSTTPRTPEPPPDDSLMSRFEEAGLRRFRARDAVFCVLLAGALLVLFTGGSIRKQGEELRPGVERSALLAVGRPAAWLANALPLASVGRTATGWLSPEEGLGGAGAFANVSYASGVGPEGVPVVTPEAFDPASIGQKPAPKRRLRTLLVTGDSMSTPLDDDLARRLVGKGVHVIEEPHLGTGISETVQLNWGKLARVQVAHHHPEAVVMFIGAAEGFAMQAPDGHEVECCNAEWAAIYANRARQMANTYRQGGAARVYWITLPAPRKAENREIARTVNAAIEVAVQPWASQVRLIDSVPTFTPGFAYRDAMRVAGRQTIVREADGIHLNEAGSNLLAEIVIARMGQDFEY